MIVKEVQCFLRKGVAGKPSLPGLLTGQFCNPSSKSIDLMSQMMELYVGPKAYARADGMWYLHSYTCCSRIPPRNRPAGMGAATKHSRQQFRVPAIHDPQRPRPWRSTSSRRLTFMHARTLHGVALPVPACSCAEHQKGKLQHPIGCCLTQDW